MSEFSVLARRAKRIQEELRQGVKKPFKDVIDVSWGDQHRTGVRPLTFVRQVLAACFYPELISSNKLPVDVRLKAQKLLEQCDAGSVGSYSATAGIPEIVRGISEFIMRRDGGVPSSPDNIFISAGSQWSLTNILKVLVNSSGPVRTGVLVPVPCYSVTMWSLTGLGAGLVSYDLEEQQNWKLQIKELQRALESAEGVCRPAALYVINPGNPSGHVQSRTSMQEVIRFVAEKKLFLLADEVYQDCVYGDNREFISYKKVLAEMGPPLSETVELASFHSASKGIMGECGLRGGYVELVNVDPEVLEHIHTLFSVDSCAPVTGQMVLDLMMNPPQPGDPSYPLYQEEVKHIRTTLRHNVKRVVEVLNSLPGFCCQPVDGGLFVFPRIDLPSEAVQEAKELGMQPETFYSIRMLEDVGVVVSPGHEYGQKEGTHHIRICIGTAVDVMEELLTRLSSFHTNFMKEFPQKE